MDTTDDLRQAVEDANAARWEPAERRDARAALAALDSLPAAADRAAPAWYRPQHVTQRTDHPCWSSLCWDAVGAWLVDGATLGAVQLAPGRFAELAGGGSGKRIGCGLRAGTERDLVAGVRALGLAARIVDVSRAQARRLLSTRRPQLYAIATDYELWPADGDCMVGDPGPDTNHAIGWDPGTARAVMNPLCRAYQAVDLADVLRAASAYQRQQGRDGIRLVSVIRPVPESLPADLRRIASLERELAEADERDAMVRQHAAAILELVEPD